MLEWIGAGGVLLGMMAAVISEGAEKPDFPHVTAALEKGRFKAWPANGGMWNWGNEVLLMYYDGISDYSTPDGHAVDMQKRLWTEQARSLDGGKTWKIERNPLTHPDDAGKIPELPASIDFTHPDLALCFKMTHWEYGTSYLYYSTDRGKKWNGPYQLPLFGLESVSARTSYIINSASDCIAFVSGGKTHNEEDGAEVFAIHTTDGGKTWTKLARSSRPTPEHGKEKSNQTIMPSAVRLGPKSLLCLSRCTDKAVEKNWIEAWRSEDDGQTWTFASTIDTNNSSTPPALVRLPEGALVVTYGYRQKPFGVRARFSQDNGTTWSKEVILREDGGNWDLGYTRNVLLPDGTLLTSYYFNDDIGKERRIEVTRWHPQKVLDGLSKLPGR